MARGTFLLRIFIIIIRDNTDTATQSRHTVNSVSSSLTLVPCTSVTSILFGKPENSTSSIRTKNSEPLLKVKVCSATIRPSYDIKSTLTEASFTSPLNITFI